MSQEFQPLKPEKSLERKERLLRTVRRLRFDFIDDLPSVRLLPGMPNYNFYKCRTNFFSTIAAVILSMRQEKLISGSETEKELEEFMKFCDTIRGKIDFYIREDIDKANRVLDFLIKKLS